MDFRFSKAEQIAISVLDSCGLDDPTQVEINEIILGRKAFYEEIPLEGKDGEIVSYHGKSIIHVNSQIPFFTRKRFACAHELGHFEMHRNLQPIFTDTEEDMLNWYKAGPHEVEANEFAAEFLMPSQIFYKECERKQFGPSVIEHLANRFQVSKTAAILKFVKRGNHPVVIVYCKDNRMKWWKSSDDFPYFLEFERDKHPPTGSVAYELFTTTNVYSGDELKQDIWKSDWFRMRDDDDSNSRFFEYCLFVRSYNYTISVIWER